MNVKSHLSGSIYLVVAVLIAAAMLLNACVPLPTPIPVPAPPKAGLANPASVNCADKGGQLKIEKDAQGGEFGICVFPDGSQCEEWAFMRGECKPGQEAITPAPAASATAPSAWEDALKNGRYELPNMEAGVFQLKDGKYEKKYGDGTSQVYRVELVTMATGDLTADGEEDAVVVLAWNGGGSGTFYNLVAVGNQGGTLQQVAAEPLGDRIQVKALKIQDGKINVDMLTHEANDPACCPTQRVMRTYRLDGSALKVVS